MLKKDRLINLRKTIEEKNIKKLSFDVVEVCGSCVVNVSFYNIDNNKILIKTLSSKDLIKFFDKFLKLHVSGNISLSNIFLSDWIISGRDLYL